MWLVRQKQYVASLFASHKPLGFRADLEFEAFQIGETERVVEQSESPFLLRVEFLDAEYVVLVMVRVGI